MSPQEFSVEIQTNVEKQEQLSGGDDSWCRRLIEKRDALHAGNFETLTAAHVLAHHHVVPAEHVGARFSELGAVTVISARWKIPLLGAHQPLDLVLGGLMAMRAVQSCWFLVGALVVKFAFIHRKAGAKSQVTGVRPEALGDYYTFEEWMCEDAKSAGFDVGYLKLDHENVEPE